MPTETDYTNLERWTDAPFVDDLTLIKQWKRMVYKQALRYKYMFATQDDVDDIAQTVFVRLIQLPQSVRSYNTYVRQVIIGDTYRVATHLIARGATPVNYDIHPYYNLRTVNYEDLTAQNDSTDTPFTAEEQLDALVGGDTWSAEHTEARAVLTRLLDSTTLTPTERAVLYYRYFHGMTFPEISKIIGLGRRRILDIELEALHKLRVTAKRTPKAYR